MLSPAMKDCPDFYPLQNVSTGLIAGVDDQVLTTAPASHKRGHDGLPFLAQHWAATLVLVPATPCTPSGGARVCIASVQKN